MSSISDQLRQSTIFAELGLADLESVAGISQVQQLETGREMMREGAAAEQILLIVKGKAAVKAASSTGREVDIDELGPGEFLGWNAVIEPYVYVASAWTTEPTEVIAIPGDQLRALCDTNMTIGYHVFRAISSVMSRRFGHALGRYGSEELHRFKIFAALDSADLDAVAKIAHVKEYATGQELTTEGEDADRLYLFLRGRAVVKVHSPEGVEVLIDQVAPGELLGWSAAVDPHVYTASSWTTEPSEVIVVPGPELRRLCETNKHIGYAVAKGIGEVISRRFGHAIGKHGDLREKDLRAFSGGEHVLWENGEIQLTTEAVLIGMGGDSPEVVPLDALLDTEVRGDVVIFHAHGGDVSSPPLDQPGQLAALVRDAMLRTRRAHRRSGED